MAGFAHPTGIDLNGSHYYPRHADRHFFAGRKAGDFDGQLAPAVDVLGKIGFAA
jgi:hypothetical protein